MAKQTTQLVRDTNRDLLDIERQLESAKKDRDKLTKQISSAKGRLTRKQNDPRSHNKVIDAIIREFKTLGLVEGLLIRQIDLAVETNTEFAHPSYLKPLYRVARSPDIYKYRREGAGWDTVLRVDIEFQSLAGTLEDWAEGILFYRDELGVEETDTPDAGQKATFYWMGKVVGTPLETRTIRGRLEGSGRIAPYWEILNGGSQPLLSDRSDGTFNPMPAVPTGFVEEAERQGNNLLRNYLREERQRWFAEIEELKAEIERAEDMRESYNQDIAQLKPEAQANRRVYDSFGEKKAYIDQNKLQEAVRRLRADEGFETKTIELSRRGSPYRIRPTVRRLEGLL